MAFEQLFGPASSSGAVVVGAILVVGVIIVLAILAFVAWLWMIVDCAKRNKFRNGDRVMWILLLVLTGFIGMLLYYFMEMRDAGRRRD